MKTTATNYSRGLPIGSRCKSADNTGVKVYQIIGVINVNGTKKRRVSATIGDIVTIVAKQGLATKKKKVLRGIVVRQVCPIFRKNKGYRLGFHDNAIVQLDDKNIVVGTSIKGTIARESVDKIPTLAGKGANIV